MLPLLAFGKLGLPSSPSCSFLQNLSTAPHPGKTKLMVRGKLVETKTTESQLAIQLQAGSRVKKAYQAYTYVLSG